MQMFRNNYRRHRFTLIEFLIAMVILVIMMGLMFFILSTAQENWRNQEQRTKLFNNSRVAFDLIERDIRSMRVSDLSGQTIGFHVYSHGGTVSDSQVFCIVTPTEVDSTAKSKLSEVKYRLHTESGQPGRFLLQRQVVSESDGADWNFLNAPTDWHQNAALPDYETVVAGVSRFSVEFYVDGGASLVKIDSTNISQFATSEPIQAIVTLTMFDESLMDDVFDVGSKRAQSSRGFTKIFYLKK